MVDLPDQFRRASCRWKCISKYCRRGRRTTIRFRHRAIFIDAEAYTEVGGNIIRDLFTEDRGGYFEDAVLLDRLVMEKLKRHHLAGNAFRAIGGQPQRDVRFAIG